MDYMKELNKISKIINTIPFIGVHIEITTNTDRYIIDRVKETRVIGFRR